MKMQSRVLKLVHAVAAAAVVTGVSMQAHADSTPAPGPDAGAPVGGELAPGLAPGPAPLRVGAIAGVGFPRPIGVEALVQVARVVDVGAEYGFLPTVTLGGVDTGMWSLAADVRIRPFRGAFFVGMAAGRQHVDASTTLTVNGLGSATEQLGLDAWFVNPRLGFLWTTDFGLTYGMDLGLQIPLSSSVSSSLPLSLYPAAQARVDSLGGSILPTVDLLRVGWLF